MYSSDQSGTLFLSWNFRDKIKKTKRFMAHDEQNECSLGDIVVISETRPTSRKKRWAVKQILTKSTISN